MKYDVIIIGAGTVGGSVARNLSRYELSVLCLEKEADVCCGITKGNTGIIHSPALIPSGTKKALLAARGSIQFEKLSTDLGFGYQKPGALVLGYSDEDRKVLEENIQQGDLNRRRAGIGKAAYKIIEGDALFKMEPALNRSVECALFTPDAGRIIPYEYGIALWENAVMNGVELKLNRKVCSVKRASGGAEGWVVGTETAMDSEQYEGQFIVNASGHGSNKIGIAAGFTESNIQRVKGQYLILDRNFDVEINHILFQVPEKGQKAKGKGILVTKTVYGNIMIGPDARRQESDDDTSTDISSIAEVIAGAEKSVPSIDAGKTIKTFAGVRPRPEGKDFIIEGENNFIHLCGIESPGLTASPAIAAEVTSMLEQMGLRLRKKDNFESKRKPVVTEVLGLDKEEAERRIKLPDGSPEKLICRCEQVPGPRIIDALGRGIPVTTIDGVKRRTRAGQGSCQGAFCGSRVRAILAKSLNVDEDEITQRGSEPLLNRVSVKDIRKLGT